MLGIDAPDVEALVAEARSAGTLEVANYLCPGNTVASGVLPALEEFLWRFAPAAAAPRS